ncbi:2-amino-4-hydroxy-6-hydroxymethyldihydropteridinepyrophosphokinase [Aliiroseovarius pelagivivens]|uniref:2-amino-4-hydroxy-6-hydroxymethyldihydropteridine pyrophosphokinase n=1 Tax=Aliiroseovarius pelagivivens TaxID=1639690 RepID=A0A2R8ARD7_9RHOB|nr:2-amino-4-hydroxy-6-hydroxymethyldihydropteridine diphosphokinase [Aliiroseovarius pelagivivens]SPF78612.1 2-amino-4-hydroxy-6-hydroxymethyldihydropteridinepyrophosphokinase [Aliiroseovarius pelagivivens]
MPQAKNHQKAYSKALVLLGSNVTYALEESSKLVRDALNCLSERGLRITSTSHYYSTACFPAGAGPDFINVAAQLMVDEPPESLLIKLHEVEDVFGRERPSRWAQRTLDIDLIAYDDLVMPDRETFQHWMNLPLEEQMKQAPDQLILPHPRVQDRAFALIPLSDVAPDWRHPVLGKSIKEMVEALSEDEKSEVSPFEMG